MPKKVNICPKLYEKNFEMQERGCHTTVYSGALLPGNESHLCATASFFICFSSMIVILFYYNRIPYLGKPIRSDRQNNSSRLPSRF